MKRQQSISSFFVPKNPQKKSRIDGGTNSHGDITRPTLVDNDNDNQQPASPDKQQQPPSLPFRPGLVGGCVEPDRFTRWKEGRGWLAVNEDGSVKCSICSDVRALGPLTQERVHIDPAFINGIMAKNAKKLHNKISKHGKCQSHLKCNEIVKKRVEDVIERAIDNGAALWRKANERRLKVTESCLRTAYTICKNDLSFKIQPALVELQQLNGLNLGNMLHSDKACRNMLMFIGEKMSAQLAEYVVKSPDKFSILIDESTTTSNKTCLIVYIRIPFQNQACNFFNKLIELEAGTGEAICNTLLQCLNEQGIDEDILRTRLLGFATDGAAVMMGRYKGVATLMRERTNTDLVMIHCMNHKLELAVHDAVKKTTQASHFQMFIDSLYAFFSQSPKQMRELEAVATELGVRARRVGKVFDVRWLSSSCTSVTALWESYPALVQLFWNLSENNTRSTKEKAKCAGIHAKMTQWLFVSEMACVKDALETLKALSLFLQRRDATAITAKAEVDIAVKSLKSMIQKDGVNTRALKEENARTHTFKGVKLSETSETQHKKSEEFRSNFFLALTENIMQRLEGVNDALSAAAVLNPNTWPSDEEDRALFGDTEVLYLHRALQMDSTSPVLLLKDFREYKHQGSIGENLQKLMATVSTLPVSTAECERGFSAMNAILADERNRMMVETLNNLLFISVNGPEVEFFPAEKYAELWIREGRHAADDAATGRRPKKAEVPPQTRLFC